jgi:hypothetical protein
VRIPWGAGGGHSERVVRLFTTEVTSDQILGNWYHFIKPNNSIKNLLRVNYLRNTVPYFVTISFFVINLHSGGWNQGPLDTAAT